MIMKFQLDIGMKWCNLFYEKKMASNVQNAEGHSEVDVPF